MSLSYSEIAELSGRYADAMFAYAVDKNVADQVEADFAVLAEALRVSPALYKVFHNPTIRRDRMVALVDALAKHFKLSPNAIRFVKVLAANRRMFLLDEIAEAYEKLMLTHRGELAAHVTSAQALSKKEVDAIALKLKKVFGADIKPVVKVDPSVLGGLRVKVGSKMYDNTLATKLDKLSLALKAGVRGQRI